MAQFQVAVILLAVVIAVIVATRPAPPRRRRTRSPRPPDGNSDPGRWQAPLPAVGGEMVLRPVSGHLSRNRWDRPDLLAGVGHGQEFNDIALSLWPALRLAPR